MQKPDSVQWANPGALGLAAFGFTTLLLQFHNLGLISDVIPMVYGFFWGGAAQVIAGVIDARRGDTFGLTAFTSYGFFWIALALGLVLQHQGIVAIDAEGLGWLMIVWAVFTFFMGIGTLKMTVTHVTIFGTLTILFILLALHFLAGMDAKIAGAEGLICGASAVYGAAAIIINDKFGRTVLPLGQLKK